MSLMETLDEAEYLRLQMFYRDRVAKHETQFPGYSESWDALSRRLTERAGKLVVPPLEREGNADGFAERLEFWEPTKVKFVDGEPSQCHYNVAQLWLMGEVESIATGYALNEDLWRQHSWGLTKNGTIVETTAERELYAGILLDNEGPDIEAIRFAFANGDEETVIEAVLTQERVLRIVKANLEAPIYECS